MASKHLKQSNKSPEEEKPSSGARHAKASEAPRKAPAHEKAPAGKMAKAPKKPKTDKAAKTQKKPKTGAGTASPKKAGPDKAAKGPRTSKKAKGGRQTGPEKDQVISLTDALTDQLEASLAQAAAARSGRQTVPPPKAEIPKPKPPAEETPPEPDEEPEAPPEEETPKRAKKDKKVVFRRDRTKKPDGPGHMSHRDAVGAIVALVAALVLLAASAVIWFYRDSFSPDGMVLSADTAAVPQEEYVFDAGSGEAFAAAGRGLAVANTAGFELLDGDGTPVTSMVMQTENPACVGCERFAAFYDLGGRRLAVARFDGTVEELDVEGDILSATVSQNGYLAVTTEQAGYRALVTVYDPELEEIYEWYSSSAWVISAAVSPDGRKLAVLSYTASGSEVRFFDLSRSEQTGSFAVEDTVLLDVHWFTSRQLCALSSEQVLFFDGSGEWQNTYSFEGQYLVGYTFDGSNCAAFALSPYRAGTTATLVSLDSVGNELGTAGIQSEIVCLTAADLEVMVLCSDGAILYTSSLAEKGRLNGLPGFKYGLLRDRGEALLIAANYAEVYTF